ncbi:flagellar biosynthesis protein [Sodalis-like endosymbiont of Proechinophthirus fluctus]|uniref:flagellar basal body-associated FliL family protein n=1 Tax=Sodalis-like endosymbiont of Proechinophthirus fluctus TaxID=1462730 RepID=UPI0007A856D1|nr:flagellar basal body-associated FliL family protein [Sodalis-like endosymbiont of Proechinophthirus fluctus]KYP97211.1 flagellar biosynthesis protein [Sodalis-like endosymbiont of Proechinophthirus fluctus]
MSGINTIFTKNRVITVIILGLIVVLAINLLVYLQSGVKEELLPVRQTVDDLPAEHGLPPVYFPLDSFTVSLQPEDGDYGAMLYVDLTLRLRDEKTRELVENQLPELRNHLILLLSQQSPASLISAADKQALLKRIKRELNQQYPSGQSPFVTDVFFNSFIVR